MKLVEMNTCTDKKGFLVIPPQLLARMGIHPEEEISLTYVSESGEMDNTYAQFIVTPNGIAAKLIGETAGQFDDGNSLSLPNELLNAAQIPVDSDLEVLCTNGAIVILAADVLNELPEELGQLFADLGIDPETVRGVIREGGYLS